MTSKITQAILLALASALTGILAQAQEDEHAHHQPAPPQPAAPAVDHSAHAMPNETSTLRDPDAYADGYDFSQLPMRHAEHDNTFGVVRAERFEGVQARDGEGVMAYDLRADYGGDYHRAALRVEGQSQHGSTSDIGIEAMWQHAIAAFWNSTLGVRGDFDDTARRNWLAVGVHGLAPYWFEVETALYVDPTGRTALKFEGSYELLLTQRLVLQPSLAADLYGKADDERALGSGLAHVGAGLRLRYHIRREFAPYVGMTWDSAFGGTADYARAASETIAQWRGVAGVRFWF